MRGLEFGWRAKLANVNSNNKVEQKLTSGNVTTEWQQFNNIMEGRDPRTAVADCPDPLFSSRAAEQLLHPV